MIMFLIVVGVCTPYLKCGKNDNLMLALFKRLSPVYLLMVYVVSLCVVVCYAAREGYGRLI